MEEIHEQSDGIGERGLIAGAGIQDERFARRCRRRNP
jgi:hypothetical protein